MRQNVLIISIVALLIPVAAFSATIVVPDDQPPYPSSGDTDQATCTVTAAAP